MDKEQPTWRPNESHFNRDGHQQELELAEVPEVEQLQETRKYKQDMVSLEQEKDYRHHGDLA